MSKLLVMLLLASVISALSVGYAGYRSGSQALTDAAYERLETQRGSKAREIENYLTQLETAAKVYSASDSAINAARSFSAGYRKLADESLTPAQTNSLRRYYSTAFLPALKANSGGNPSIKSFFPSDPAQQYLQAYYTAPYGESDDVQENFAAAAANNDAGDGSAWSQAHARFHPLLREAVERSGYEDAMIARPDGRIVYTMYKGVDLGSNILNGPFASARLSEAFQRVIAQGGDGAVVTDFEPYAPSRDVPTAFSMSPIEQDGKLLGVLLLQLPTSRINDVMTNGGQWKASGFGETGETFLVGPDHTMRSISRLLVEDPSNYRSAVVAAGTPRSAAEQAERTGDTILIQPVRGDGLDAAFAGNISTAVKPSYHGPQVLVSYQPIDSKAIDWVIVAQVDEDEALAPAREFLRNIAVATLFLILVITLLAMLAAQLFVRPVRELLSGVRRVAAGDLDSRVSVSSADEFGDLASSFNSMATSLRSKQELIDAEVAENHRLLLSVMPANVAERLRAGEKNITEDHQDVSVAFITIDGLDAIGDADSPETTVALTNDLLHQIDVAAETYGVEKVRSLRSGYLASCGLVVPRVDHAQRMVDFARELPGVLQRFNAQHDLRLSLRAGIDTGVVSSGLVGGSALYDMWGETVNVAFGMQRTTQEPGIYVSSRIYDQVRDTVSFVSAGNLDASGDPQPIWRLQEDTP